MPPSEFRQVAERFRRNGAFRRAMLRALPQRGNILYELTEAVHYADAFAWDLSDRASC